MSARQPPPDGVEGHDHQPGHYAIRIAGQISPRWSDWFDGLRIEHDDDGTTTLYGEVVDQAALHGLLRRVRDLGLPLISVVRIAPEQPDTDAPRE